ncbi:MAG: hypothetical protein V3W03_04260, partial [Gammaproteobacteria bacterium]
SGPVCGDQTCDPGEDECSCAQDCGTPPSTETVCDDGVDEDCDGDDAVKELMKEFERLHQEMVHQENHSAADALLSLIKNQVNK